MKIKNVAILSVLLVCAISFHACSTFDAKKSGAPWRDVAAATCEDLKTARSVASAAVAWAKIYRPDKEALFVQKIEPILNEASLGVDAYCAAVDIAKSSESISDVLAQQDKLIAMLSKVGQLVTELDK